MAIEYVDAVNGDGLFDIIGQLADLLETLNEARDNVTPEALEAMDRYKSKTDSTLDLDQIWSAFAANEQGWRFAGDGFASTLQFVSQGFLGEVVKADNASIGDDIEAQLQYLIAEMISDGFYVAGNSTSVVAAADGASVGHGLGWFFRTKGHDSKATQNMLAETIEAVVSSVSDEVPTLRLTGERAARLTTAEDFPAGSGISRTLTPLTAADSLLSNADFEEVNVDGTPADWQIVVGSAATINVPASRVVSVDISGTPTSGSYFLKCRHPFTGKFYFTESLPFNASGPQLEAALRAVPGYELVEVSTTGTSPNFNHTVTWTGVTASPTIFTASNSFDTGMISISQDSGANVNSLNGRSLQFLGHASQLQQIVQRVELQPDTVYVLAALAAVSGDASAVGLLRMSIVDDAGQAISTDHGGTQVTLTKSFADLQSTGSGNQWIGMLFSLPDTISQPVYVQIEKIIADDTFSLFIDNVILAEATELYAGGPFAAAVFSRFLKNYDFPTSVTLPYVVGDKWTLTASNDHNSEWQLRFNQLFDMSEKRLVLPHTGSTEIPASLFDESYESSSSTSSSTSSSSST